ncbi:hypothetical protein HMPREF9567_01941 [Cutibacterium acnes HL013PA1]|nr:hypothetical protein HMPREF9567_01941 [Cutibacterium acnes HL013PA1]
MFWLLTGVPSMVGGSSLPGVGRLLPGFILAANYTELPGDAPIRRCERQQRDFWAALDDGDLNPRPIYSHLQYPQTTRS